MSETGIEPEPEDTLTYDVIEEQFATWWQLPETIEALHGRVDARQIARSGWLAGQQAGLRYALAAVERGTAQLIKPTQP